MWPHPTPGGHNLNNLESALPGDACILIWVIMHGPAALEKKSFKDLDIYYFFGFSLLGLMLQTTVILQFFMLMLNHGHMAGNKLSNTCTCIFIIFLSTVNPSWLKTKIPHNFPNDIPTFISIRNLIYWDSIDRGRLIRKWKMNSKPGKRRGGSTLHIFLF